VFSTACFTAAGSAGRRRPPAHRPRPRRSAARRRRAPWSAAAARRGTRTTVRSRPSLGTDSGPRRRGRRYRQPRRHGQAESAGARAAAPSRAWTLPACCASSSKSSTLTARSRARKRATCRTCASRSAPRRAPVGGKMFVVLSPSRPSIGDTTSRLPRRRHCRACRRRSGIPPRRRWCPGCRRWRPGSGRARRRRAHFAAGPIHRQPSSVGPAPNRSSATAQRRAVAPSAAAASSAMPSSISMTRCLARGACLDLESLVARAGRAAQDLALHRLRLQSGHGVRAHARRGWCALIWLRVRRGAQPEQRLARLLG